MTAGDKHFNDEKLVHGPQRYLEADGDTDQTTSFIDCDTDASPGISNLNLRDDDHTAGMHYHIRLSSNSTGSVTIQRKSGSSKTISGKFAGQTLSAATSATLFQSDGLLRIRPDGNNWAIY